MKQNIETLKEYFETGDKPTQQNYTDLIDSLGMPIIGEIKTMSFGFAPSGWKKCNGQLLDPAQFPVLFTLIGTTYGGDGTTSFALPNLVGRIPLGFGTTDGLSSYTMAQNGGEETHQLTEDEIPSHDHIISFQHSQDTAIRETPIDGDVLASGVVNTIGGNSVNTFGPNTNTTTSNNSSSSYGGSNPHNIIQPYLAVNYIIAVEGITPS